MSQFDWPLMVNNIPREDIDKVIDFLIGEPILTQSTQVAAFEKEWSEWLGVRYSVFLNSGSSANILSFSVLKALYGTGEVIIAPLGWVSDIVALLINGFKPVFVDINPRTLSIDENQVIKRINANTKAVFCIHVQGFNGLSDTLLDTLKKKNIPLIEDACEAHGATFNGQKVGSFGLISNFSFYFAHHLSTVEGGMVCTNDERIYQMARMFRSHGMTREMTNNEMKEEYKNKHQDLNPDFIFAYPGFNMRNTEIGAVIGRNQLRRLDSNNTKRIENFKLFLDNLDPAKYQTDLELEGSCNYAFNLIAKKSDYEFFNRVMAVLREKKIEFRRGSAGGGNQMRQPYLKGIIPQNDFSAFPNVEHVHFFGMYIGNYPDISVERIKYLCNILNSIT